MAADQSALDAQGYVEGTGTASVTLDLPLAPRHAPLTVIDHITAATVPGSTALARIAVIGTNISRKQMTNAIPDTMDLDWGGGYPVWSTSGDDGREYGNAVDVNWGPPPGGGTTLDIFGGTAASGELSQAIGQSYTVGANAYRLSGVAVYVKVVGRPSDSLTLTFYDTQIDGSLLATSGAVPIPEIQPGGQWVYFLFPTSIFLTASTQYFFQIIRSGARDTSNYATVPATNTSAFAGGGSYTRDNTAWSAESATVDLSFRTLVGVRVIFGAPTSSTNSTLLVTYHFEKPSRIRS